MDVPSYKSFIQPILRYLARHDSAVAAADVYKAAASDLQLSDDALGALLASGGLAYRNRAAWAINWLKRAGLAEAPVPGAWQLTAAGRELAAGGLKPTAELLSRFSARVERRALRTRAGRSAPTSIARHRTPATVGNRKDYRLPPRPLAIGGQAEVYEAIRKSDGTTVVFKRSRNRSSPHRMRREIEVQSSLRHPNIMPILDWDRTHFSWYVMPRGIRTMADLARPVEPALLLRIVSSVIAALEAAHYAKHPHRDVKPQNVIELQSTDGNPRWVLADWGLTRRAPGTTTAKLTETGQLLGSAGFAPPEAYRDAHNVGLPGDVYALGQLIAWAHGVEPVPNMSPIVTGPWERIVSRLTQQEPRLRPQNMTELRQLVSSAFPEDPAEGPAADTSVC
jgi:Protein kinase domain/Mrr N-terminal domain